MTRLPAWLPARLAALSGLCCLGLLAAATAGVPAAAAAARAQPDTVKVGLLVPTRGERAAEGRAARRGAALAVAEANREGSIVGRTLELVVRPNDDRWGSGTKEIVRLVFDPEVRAILGPLDGRSAHLVAQIATKGRIAVVSPWATEASLTRARVPWIFRVVPDDRRQAEVLVRGIHGTRGLDRVAAVSDEGFDARRSAAAFVHAAAAGGHPVAGRFVLGRGDAARASLLERIGRGRFEGVVLFGASPSLRSLVYEIRGRGKAPALFGNLALGEAALADSTPGVMEGVVVVAPTAAGSARAERFAASYASAYGGPPRGIAAYAYDAMRVLIDAMARGGPGRDAIRREVAACRDTVGVTGPIRFDGTGNRLGPIRLIPLRTPPAP